MCNDMSVYLFIQPFTFISVRPLNPYLVHFFIQTFLYLLFSENIFAAVLELYKDDGMHSLPNSEEVLVCTSETTSEEVITSVTRFYTNRSTCIYEKITRF